VILNESLRKHSIEENNTMAASPSIDLSGWMSEHLEQASPDLLRAMLCSTDAQSSGLGTTKSRSSTNQF
jgi:hypothetical protein